MTGHRRPSNRRGFTLIEVLLSVTILATISTLAARSISQAVKAKIKLQDQIDDASKMRDALRLIERDINLAFHYRDVEKELQDILKKKNGQATTPPGQPPFYKGPDQPPLPQNGDVNKPPEVERKDPTTHFVGAANSLSFVTMNNARMVRNSRQADFIEVSYALKNCTSVDGSRSSQCLWRRSSPIVDDDVTLGGDEVVLLENVTEFALKYIGKGKQDWVAEWRTDKGGDAVTKERLPQAVEISLTVKKEIPGAAGKAKTYKMQIVASVHFPNNKEESNAQPNSANPNTPANGTPSGP